MFREACQLAMAFTQPVVMSLRTSTGICKSSVGTFVVVNNEGWIVTAAHIIKQIADVDTAVIKARSGDGQPQSRQQRRAMKAGKAPPIIEAYSVWWGGLADATATPFTVIPDVDLAIGKL